MTIEPIVTPMTNTTTTTCKFCAEQFTPIRAGAQYCCAAHRTAAYRKRMNAPMVSVQWMGHIPKLSQSTRTRHISDSELANELLSIAQNEDGGKPKTGRRYYYLALSHGLIRPDMGASEEAKKSRDAAYDKVLAVLGTLRKSGQLSWDMVLDLTRSLDQWQTYDSPRDARKQLRRRYTEDRWLGQPYYPVFVVEKDTLEPICKPMSARWQIPFASSRGYASLTQQHDVALLFEERGALYPYQLPMIYFLSDFDPSGLDLERAWKQSMDDFGVVVEFVRLGMNAEQAADYPDLSIEVKVSDARSKSFIEQYGDRCWEADVLPEDAIRVALDNDIGTWLDFQQWSQRTRDIEQARKLL